MVQSLERNGIKIDQDELAKVEQDFVTEKQQLEIALRDIVTDVMGDTPINLNSGADMTVTAPSRHAIS